MTHRHVLPEPHHRNVQAGGARAAVFGASDGLCTSIALTLGVIGTHAAMGAVRAAGFAGLIAGACSMAAGEYVSMRAHSELLERELSTEEHELTHNHDAELEELVAIYQGRGLRSDLAVMLAGELMREPQLALETHARDELGINPDELGSARVAAASSFVAFALGAAVPLVPLYLLTGRPAALTALVVSAIAAISIGAALSSFTGKSKVRAAARQLMVTSAVSLSGYLIGLVIGASGVP
jgi:VIT1/CCC1 family predicted Fe2+/Mn2+ transporter